ncbi:hypothetical protein CRG98_000541 [Punica granatum]|uniref:Disease resistance RPP13-like protein 1 n=1 Tax=Punica granatum TaxID=22663 RepID=A0A2I0LEI0_PUNGR|nr:hypothetical protein CRG98_000541 [Punica granatum]
MAELLLGACLTVLFDRLASRELLDFARREELHSLFKRWEKTLQDIQIVLEDAEDRAMGGESRVTPWLDDLKDLAYDMEDLLDEFATTEALRSSSMPSDKSGASSNKLCKLFLPSCCASFLSPRRLMFDHKMRSKVEEIDGRLADIMRRKETLGLREGVGGRIPGTSHQRRLPSTSLAEPFLFGRDADIKAILNLVMPERRDVLVIPIVGMGGVGKTTVAQSVYNDEIVGQSFLVRVWACVSDEFDVLAITRTIFLQLVGGAHEGKDLNALQVELQRCLSGKKFLIVLDDVWNEDYESWTLLRRPFESGGVKGSKIIVTTRSQSVASIMKSRTGPVYPLGTLSHGDCLALLAYHALGMVNFDDHPYLKLAGERIVEKCGGLPLAAKTLGGVLRSEYEPSQWIDIAESKIWDLPKTKGVPQALNLSYIYLPKVLKRCFVYTAVFPKDYEFTKDDLISLWMAEGLLGRPHQEGSMRDFGAKYFHELLSRSFFQPSGRGKSLCVMHDLLNDLATSIAGNSCLSLGEDGLASHKEKTSLEKVRHLSLIPHREEVSGRFEGFPCLRRLRTFIALKSFLNNHVADKVIDDVLRHQKHLRALSLCRYQIKEVPNCIGTLRQLRYLNLSGSRIEFLPSSLSTLYNLETLILKGCSELVELPSWINKLINLRCVDVSGTRSLRKMPRGIGDLFKLEILPKFIVGGNNGPKLKELKDLRFLQEELTIQGLCNAAEVGDARDAALDAKPGLTSLMLSWELEDGLGSAGDAASQMQVLDWLQPHTKIKNLEIEGYGGTMFPSWIGGFSFVHLERVTLRNCRKTETLPSLGLLPSLKEVTVQGMDAVCAVGPEFYGYTAKPFPSLETLAFAHMHAWVQWSFSTGSEWEKGPFPQLRELRLRNCSKLIIEKWAIQLPALVKLTIESCPLLETPIATISLPSLKNELHIETCDELIFLWEDKDRSAGINHYHALKHLTIEGCHRLVKIGTFPPNLEYLSLEDCENLEELPDDRQNYGTSLKVLRIQNCPKVMSLPEGMMQCNLVELKIRNCSSLASFSGVKPPRNLINLEVVRCEKLQRLPEEILTAPKSNRDDDYARSSNGGKSSAIWCDQHPQLQVLTIYNCPSLGSVLNGDLKLVPSLKKLTLYEAEFLGSSLEGITVGLEQEDNSSLEEIGIYYCKMIKRLTPHLHRFTGLTKLQLDHCPSLELERFPLLPDSLCRFSLEACHGIKSLPSQMHALRSLRELEVRRCSGITSFPEEGLPPNLDVLEVAHCENLNQPMSKWGLQQITTLRRLKIGGKIGCLIGTSLFPPPDEDEGQGLGGWHMLPRSIARLEVWNQENMVTLSSGLQSHLTSLRALEIKRCRKLKFLPREGFPPSLGSLEISYCNEDIVKRCSKEGGGGDGGGGDYFPLIERIPCVTLALYSD